MNAANPLPSCPTCDRLGFDRGDGSVYCHPCARTEARILAAGIPGHFAGATFDTVPDAWSEPLQALVDGREGPFVVLGGPNGTGKTWAAAAALRLALRDVPGRFVEASDFLLELTSTWRRDSPRSEASIWARYSKLDFLVLDDLADVRFGDHAAGALTNLINRRLRDDLRTVITVDKPLAELADPRAFGDRMVSRLRSGRVLLCDGPDRRKS